MQMPELYTIGKIKTRQATFRQQKKNLANHAENPIWWRTETKQRRIAPSAWYLFLSCVVLPSIAGCNRRPGADVEGAKRSFSLPIPPLEVEGDDFSTTSSKRFLLLLLLLLFSKPSRNKAAAPSRPFALLPPRPSVPKAELRSLDISLSALCTTKESTINSSNKPSLLHVHKNFSSSSFPLHQNHQPLRLLQNPNLTYHIGSLLRLLFLLSLLQTKRKQTEKKCEMIHHIRVSRLLPATRTEESSREQKRENSNRPELCFVLFLRAPGRRDGKRERRGVGKETANREEGEEIP